MHHPALNHGFDTPPILAHTHFPQTPPIPNHQKDTTNLCQPDKSRGNKAVLQTHIRDPRRDSIPDRKAHRVAYQDDCDDSFAGQRAVRVNAVRDGELETECVCHSYHTHGEDGTEPVDMVRCTDAPEDEAKRDEEEGGDEEPEAVLGFHNSVVLSRFADDKVIAHPARIRCT